MSRRDGPPYVLGSGGAQQRCQGMGVEIKTSVREGVGAQLPQ
ncbi:hypothetical protein [Streptomyces sp. NPDC093261]